MSRVKVLLVEDNDGVRASNFSWAAGQITGADIAAGTIDHALEVSLTSFQLASGRWTAPATAPERQGYGTIQMGAKIGIPAGIAKPAGLSSIGSMVFDALQRYGAYAGDYAGGPWPTFYTDPLTVTDREVEPLFAFWDHNGSADMEKIDPLLRIAARISSGTVSIPHSRSSTVFAASSGYFSSAALALVT